MKDDLNLLREQIDSLDEKIVALLDKRFEIVDKISQIKKHLNRDILDVERESVVLKKVSKSAKNPIFKEDIEQIYFPIIEMAKRIQSHNE